MRYFKVLVLSFFFIVSGARSEEECRDVLHTNHLSYLEYVLGKTVLMENYSTDVELLNLGDGQLLISFQPIKSECEALLSNLILALKKEFSFLNESRMITISSTNYFVHRSNYPYNVSKLKKKKIDRGWEASRFLILGVLAIVAIIIFFVLPKSLFIKK